MLKVSLVYRKFKKCILLLLLITTFSAISHAESEDKIRQVADEIIAEATLPNFSEVGRPLPLASHWDTGYNNFIRGEDGLTPDFQLSLLEKGHRILPWLEWPKELYFTDYFCFAIKKIRDLNLPFSLNGTQWEQNLYREAKYKNLSEEQNPNVIDLSGNILSKLSPLGAVEPWYEVGEDWIKTKEMRTLQEWYPSPSKILFISNNEATKLRWVELETQSKRYVEMYGFGKDDDFKRRLVGDGWIERYRKMQDGMRDSLENQNWKEAARFVGYGGVGPTHIGRWGGWTDWTLMCTTDEGFRISPDPLMWDGGSPSYYVHSYYTITDYTVYSPQIESMNWIPMLEDAYRLNPDYWFEISVWDGHSDGSATSKREEYKARGQTYTPARYLGYVQFGMWLLRPRVLREYRDPGDLFEGKKEYFMQIVKAVDRVYDNELLKRFWRKGELVPNRSSQHPYQINIPEEYKDVDRWFLLETDLDPPRPWNLNTEIPVFTLALVLGTEPQREWLLYAFAPLGDKQGVKVRVPEYGVEEIDATVDGAFYHLCEQTGEIRRLNLD